MVAVFATLTFLIAIWLCTTVVAGTLEQSGSKIVAALNGQSPLAIPLVRQIDGRVSQRYPSMAQRRVQARAELRAAA